MSISFAYPWLLLLLAIPLALLVWTWQKTSRRVAFPFDHGRQSSGRFLATLIQMAESLPSLLLGVAIILIAGPQQSGAPQSKRILSNIEFCVDVSGSMAAKFGEATRYDASMRAIDEFLSYRKGDAFGLTFFGSSVLHWVPLTNDVSAIRCAPPFMRPENAPLWMAGTEIAKALRACKDVLIKREEGDRMVIMVTDGISFDLLNGNDLVLAEELKKNKIVVYAIHAAETEIPGTVVNVASLTGGEAFAAGDPTALEAVFQKIDSMQQTRMEKTAAETIDHFAPFCIAGLSMLAATGLALFGLRYTPW